MTHITTCSRCGQAYEEVSEEEAHHPDRQCYRCWMEKRSTRTTVQDDYRDIEPYPFASMQAPPTNY